MQDWFASYLTIHVFRHWLILSLLHRCDWAITWRKIFRKMGLIELRQNDMANPGCIIDVNGPRWRCDGLRTVMSNHSLYPSVAPAQSFPTSRLGHYEHIHRQVCLQAGQWISQAHTRSGGPKLRKPRTHIAINWLLGVLTLSLATADKWWKNGLPTHW